MSRSESFYNAISDIKDEYINDAISHNAKKKSGNARIVTEAVACVAIVCGFVALSLVLRSISKPTDGNIAVSSGTESVIVTNAAQTESDIAENTTVTETAEETAENDRAERLAEALSVVYGHEGTTKTQFKLLDSFDLTAYQTWRTPILRIQNIYFDETYDPEPVYSENTDDIIWYKGPYVRYYVSGFPEYDSEERHVVHVDICGDDSVSVCGINVNSTFEEFTQTFTALGFEVESGVSDVLPYTMGREIIEAKRDGMWITLEKESVFILKSQYEYDEDYTSALQYENGTVPAVLRMGVAVDNYIPVEQYDMP